MSNASPETITLQTRRSAERYRPREPYAITRGYLGRTAIDVDVVTALSSPRLGRINQRLIVPEDLGESEDEWQLTLPLVAAKRLRRLHKRIMYEDNVPDYDCRSLPAYVWGQESSITPGAEHTCKRVIRPTEAAVLGNLTPGQPYSIVHNTEGDVHSFLALDREYPDAMLSILGRRGLLAITSIPETLAAYESIRFDPMYFLA